MVTASQLIPYRTSSSGYDVTKGLKARMAHLRRERCPLYLTPDEFDAVLRWKLRSYYARLRQKLAENTPEVIRVVTQAAFSVTHPDEEYETELRLNLLCSLRGVAVPVASAFLALMFPEKYAVIDFRTWRQLFRENKAAFSTTDYIRYLREIRRLADELSWPVQEVDLAIWEYDRANS